MRTHRFLAHALCTLVPAALSSAQAPVSFTGVTNTSADTPANIYAVDLNNDGITDIVQDTAQSPSGFTVSLGNGDGTFKAPVTYLLPGSKSNAMAIATADLNNDGNVDIAVPLLQTNQIAVYLGNGDGTFQSPILSTINLPSGFTFNLTGSAAADFNADGNIDLVAWTSAGYNSTALYVFAGEGDGGFSSTPHLVLSGPEIQPDFEVLVGDFDSDGKADIAATTSLENSEGGTSSTTVYVLYGNNDFTFDNTTAYTADGNFNIGAGDINSDGNTDLFGLSSSQLAVFLGNSSRTFSSYFSDLPSNSLVGASPDSWNWNSQFAMADFNGDGNMDLAASAWGPNYNQAYVEFFLANGSDGQFTPQLVALTNTYTWETVPVAGLFSGNFLTPDVGLNQSPNGGSPPQNTPSYLTAELNQANSGWFGPCAYPRGGQGFNVCSAGTPLGSNTLFSAAVNSFGKLRKIELWVDGVKVQEQHHTWDQHAYFDLSGNFAAGPHQATFYAADVDNRLQSTSFSFTVGASACPSPASPSVNVCSPANNSTANSPLAATASATITGKLARMEIWVDGAKVYTETNSLTESTSLNLTAGTHKIDFYAVSTTGGLWETSAYVTIPAPQA